MSSVTVERRRGHGSIPAFLRTPPPVPVWHVRGTWDVREQETTLCVCESAAEAQQMHGALKRAGALCWLVLGPAEPPTLVGAQTNEVQPWIV